MHMLYWSPTSGSLAPMAMLEALKETTGTDYRHRMVDTGAGAHRNPDYHGPVHPLGTIPALEIEGGGTMLESGAMTLHLADLVPDCAFAPAAGSPQRAGYLDWMLFGAATLYPGYMRIYHPEHFLAAHRLANDFIASSRAALDVRWSIVERRLASRADRWLVGDRPTAADLYLAMLARWYGDAEAFGRLYPRADALRAAAMDVPAMARAEAIHAAGRRGR